MIVLGCLLVFFFFFLKERGGKRPVFTPAEPQKAALPGGPRLNISKILIDPQDRSHLYVASLSAGIFESTDGGERWAPLNSGLKTLMIQDLIIAPNASHKMLAGTFGAGIYRSEDGGAFWSESHQGLTNTNIAKLIFHPSDSNVVYAMSLNGGVFRSGDGGRTWRSWSEGLDALLFEGNHVLFAASDPATIYLGRSSGIFKRTENGSQWEAINEGLPESPNGIQVTAIVYDASMKRLLIGVSFQGMYSRAEQGTRWFALGMGPEEGGIYDIRFDLSNPKIMYAVSTTRGILMSLDEGLSWTQRNEGLPEKALKQLLQDPRHPKTFYTAASAKGELYVSKDSLRNWMNLDAGFPAVEAVEKDFLDRSADRQEAESRVAGAPPASFDKCNRCHGWTRTVLNRASHKWKVAPSRREWALTVRRMRRMMPDFSDADEQEIVLFLNANYGLPVSP